MNVEPPKYAPPVEKTSKCVFPPEGWWSEDGDQCWLPLWYGGEEGKTVDATRVKRLAYTGYKLPVTPAREFTGMLYDDITVKIAWIRLGTEEDGPGWAGRYDEMCYKSTPFDPRSYPCWEVSFG